MSSQYKSSLVLYYYIGCESTRSKPAKGPSSDRPCEGPRPGAVLLGRWQQSGWQHPQVEGGWSGWGYLWQVSILAATILYCYNENSMFTVASPPSFIWILFFTYVTVFSHFRSFSNLFFHWFKTVGVFHRRSWNDLECTISSSWNEKELWESIPS